MGGLRHSLNSNQPSESWRATDYLGSMSQAFNVARANYEREIGAHARGDGTSIVRERGLLFGHREEHPPPAIAEINDSFLVLCFSTG